MTVDVAPTNDAAWTNAINLLPLIDPQPDAVTGTWTRVNGELTVSACPFARLQIPYQPPEEYDFRIVFSVFSPQKRLGAVWQILTAKSRPFDWCIGGGGSADSSCFETIDGNGRDLNSSWTRLAGDLVNGRRYTSLVEVRKDGLTALWDGRLVAQWKTNYQDMRLPSRLRLRDGQALGVGANNLPTIFHSIEVREVTGKGTITR